MKKKVGIIFIIIMIITSSIAYGEVGIENRLRSYILADFETGEILEEYNIDEVVEIASISKLMTYLVVMDEVTKGKISLDDRIIVDEDVARVGGSSLKLEIGEVFKVQELLDAAIVVSGNDATYALAKHIGGTEEGFATMMNEKAIEIGLKNAKFYNSTGLPVVELGVQNRMTTRELFQMSKYIMERYPEVIEISRTPVIEVSSRGYFQRNTNPLLREIKEVDGLKTGFTNKAGYCYVSTFNILGKEHNTEDLRLISIVMGSKGLEERNELAKILVEYGIDKYSKKIFFEEDKSTGIIEFPRGNISEVETFPKEGFSKLIKNSDEVTVKMDLDDKIKLPLKKGDKVGKASVERKGEQIFETDIIVNEDIKKANVFVLFGRYLSNIYDNVIGD